MSKGKYVHNKRDWLNPKSSCDTGAVFSSVCVHKDSIDADLCVRDCSRSINLDLSVYDKNYKSFAARLRKVDVLIAHLEGLREGLVEGWDVMKEAK